MCLYPMTRTIKDALTGEERTVTYPCGVCPECVVARQRDMAALTILEAKKVKQPMYFFTFTYDNDSIPIYRVVKSSSDNIVERRFVTEEEDKKVRPFIISKGRYSRAVQYNVGEDFDYYFSDGEYSHTEPASVYYTPSICNRDLQNVIKNFRAQLCYKKQYKGISYSAVGEYGSKSFRPHFHMIVFGINEEQADLLSKLWKYGQVDYKRSQGTPQDVLRSSLYTSKYINKGCFENGWLKGKFVQRPHRMSSQGFGLDPEKLNHYRYYHLCFDMYGEYDPDTLKFLDGRDLSYKQRTTLVKEIVKRLQINLVDQTFSLPQKIRRKIFFNKVPKTGFKVVQDPFTGKYEGKYVDRVYYRPKRIYGYVQSYIERQQEHKVYTEMVNLGLKSDLSNFGDIKRLYDRESKEKSRRVYREKFNKYVQKINNKKNITIND